MEEFLEAYIEKKETKVVNDFIKHTIIFDLPLKFKSSSAWIEHTPFAFFLISILRPKLFVELGVYEGWSYNAFCQAVKTLETETSCYGIDTWIGDEHTGFYEENVYQELLQYQDKEYAKFSHLLRMTFDKGLAYFSDGSIDLLHIDGLHTYGTVKHDFESWLPKMSEKGVILLHDTDVRERNFGVWKLWEEISEKYPSFNFNYGYGLGIVAVGLNVDREFLAFLEDLSNESFYQKLFFSLGKILTYLSQITNLEGLVEEKENELAVKENELEVKENELAEKENELEGVRIELARKETELETVFNSTTWRIIQKYSSLMNRFFPQSSLHGRIFKLFKKGMKVLILEGPVSFVRRIGICFFYEPFFTRRIQEKKIAERTLGEVYRNELLKDDLVIIGETKVSAFLESQANFELPLFSKVKVSIILVLYNKVEYTYQCLESIKAHADIPYEVVIIDNASDDKTKFLLERTKNSKVVINKNNLGFLKACNQAVQMAEGEYILFLNNDTQLIPGVFSALVRTIEQNEAIGAVGGRLIFPDGRLQEAGSIIWKDGSCLGYGREENPFDAEYSYLREVYYCSGACLLTRRNLFLEAGMFDEQFAPAYYEETDYCMWLRSMGYKVIYQPLANIIHYEFGSSSTVQKAVKLQESNKEKFVIKWEKTLEPLYEPSQSNIIFAREANKKKKNILFIDDRVPLPQLGSGYPRSFEVLNSLVKLGHRVTFFPLQFSGRSQPVTSTFQQLGVEVIYSLMQGTKINFETFFMKRWNYYDIVLISRPHNMQKILNDIKSYNRQQYIIYDAEALFAMRKILELEVKGEGLKEEDKEKIVASEVSLARQANAVITVSENEAEIFRKHGVENIFVLGHCLDMNLTRKSFEERKNILFVGGFLTSCSPNEDAILYFANEIYPKVYEKTGAKLLVAGSNKLNSIWSLNSDKIRVMGYIPDLTAYYDACRIFVVPARFAAGIPLKLCEASSFGLPAVVTPLISKQLGWVNGDSLLVGNNESDFADKCIELYTNKKLWERIRSRAVEKVKLECSRKGFLETLNSIIDNVN